MADKKCVFIDQSINLNNTGRLCLLSASWKERTSRESGNNVHLLDLIITFFMSFFIPPPPVLYSLLLQNSLCRLQLSICQLLSGELTRPESWKLPLNRRSTLSSKHVHSVSIRPSPLSSLLFIPPLSRLVSPLIMSSVCPPCCPPSWPPLCSSNSNKFPLQPSLSCLQPSTLEMIPM